MIQQHFLQQQRLNYNHDRLLERQSQALQPRASEFRPFGTSSLPGRNYEAYLEQIHGNNHRRDSLISQSRRNIGSSSETYRLMGDGASQMLPGNVNSVIQHSRHHSLPLVHAEKFEPVKVYDHPIFGPTPAYLRPVFHDTNHLDDNYNDKEDNKHESDDDDDDHVRSSSPTNISLKNSNKIETSSITSNKHDHDHDHDDKDESDYAPLGYISYKRWKEKYANIIPVNPLLYNIYTLRSNGSINSYGQSLYSSLHRPRQLSGEEDLLTTTLSDLGSDTSDIHHATSSSSHPRYNRLQSHVRPKTPLPRSLPTIHTENDSDLSDNEQSPPDSPVPYLSRNKPNPISSFPLSSTSTPVKPVITSTIPVTVTTPTLNTSGINTTGSSTQTPLIPTTSSSISSPAPIIPSSSSTNPYDTPPAPSLSTSTIPPAPPIPTSFSSTNTSTIPPAPPMSASLLTPSSTINNTYKTPSSLPISSPPIALPMPSSLTTSTPSTTYQAPSSISVAPPTASTFPGPTTKAVTFGGLSSIPATNTGDISSSSDSDDSDKQKRRRRRKRQAAAAAGGYVDDSSSDD